MYMMNAKLREEHNHILDQFQPPYHENSTRKLKQMYRTTMTPLMKDYKLKKLPNAFADEFDDKLKEIHSDIRIKTQQYRVPSSNKAILINMIIQMQDHQPKSKTQKRRAVAVIYRIIHTVKQIYRMRIQERLSILTMIEVKRPLKIMTIENVIIVNRRVKTKNQNRQLTHLDQKAGN
eukprot:UN30283